MLAATKRTGSEKVYYMIFFKQRKLPDSNAAQRELIDKSELKIFSVVKEFPQYESTDQKYFRKLPQLRNTSTC